MKFSMRGKLSAIFEEFLRQATALLNDPRKLRRVLNKSLEKISELPRGSIQDVVEDLKTLIRVIRAYVRGEYTNIPWRSVALIVGAVLYFLDPIDLIPDFVPIVGYMDDAWVIAWVVRKLREDLENFRVWENDGEGSEEVEIEELPLDDRREGFLNVRALKQQLVHHPKLASLELKRTSVHDPEFPAYVFRWDYPEDYPEGTWTVVGEIIRYNVWPDNELLESRFDEFEDWLIDDDDWYYWQGDSSLLVQVEGYEPIIRVHRGPRSGNLVVRRLTIA